MYMRARERITHMLYTHRYIHVDYINIHMIDLTFNLLKKINFL